MYRTLGRLRMRGLPWLRWGGWRGRGRTLGRPEAHELLRRLEDKSLHSSMDCQQGAGLEAWLRGRCGCGRHRGEQPGLRRRGGRGVEGGGACTRSA